MDDLAGYTEQLLYLHVPRPMSDSAELMYCVFALPTLVLT